ncbi:tetratricopeptide repeat protein [Aliikangiella maris]|uniref:Tetratricopeptide repeat protein n=2 Tax=Aliikangiella maris TaxID=3162458 RepID=A0ABV3MNJ3_9GAMM
MKKLTCHFFAIGLCLLISSCAKNPNNNTVNREDQYFISLIDKFKQDKNAVTYQQLWKAFLSSSHTESSAVKYDEYIAIAQQLESGDLSCKEIDWTHLLNKNYWSIKPHLSAAKCKQFLGDTKGAEFHENFVSLIIDGVFSSGDGKDYFSAYEVASWGDVEDLLEIAGYKSLDFYLQIKGAGQGLYYIVIAEDLETGEQREIFFDNTRYINANLGHFSKVGNGELASQVINELSETTRVAMLGMGDLLAQEEQYEKATNWYLRASLYDSGIAYLRLASLCLKGKYTKFSEGTCLEFIIDAAELGIAEAYVLLFALYEEGIYVKPNKQLADQIFTLAEKKIGKGKVYEKLAFLYLRELFGKDRDDKVDYYFNQAAENGTISKVYVSQISQAVYSESLSEQEREKPLAQLKKFAEKGNHFAQAFYGAKLLFDSYEVTDDTLIKTALEYIEKAAEAGIPYAQFMMGNLYQYGEKYDGKREKAQAYFLKAANSWHADAQYEVARYYERLSDLAIYQSNINKILKLNKIEKVSFITSPPDTDMINWMRAAAIQGHFKALIGLGYYYEQGKGVSKDLEKAASLYKIVADHNNKNGQYSYAYMLKNGLGVERNYEAAFELFKKAQQQGHLGATNQLGLFYEYGLYVNKDLKQAFYWYNQAAEANYQWAQYNMGRLYESGLGVTSDLTQALKWYSLAAEQGHKEAKEKVKQLSI